MRLHSPLCCVAAPSFHCLFIQFVGCLPHDKSHATPCLLLPAICFLMPAICCCQHYIFDSPDIAKTSSTTVSFSSRPGDLHSKDDFFLLSNQMTVIETSLTVFNKTLYKALTPLTVPTWLRSQVANRLASTAHDWIAIFSSHNSGTHNCEWLVTDYKQFTPHTHSLAPNTTWMVDQMVDVMESCVQPERERER